MEMEETCALDMAQKDCTLQEVADVLGVSRQRVRQIVMDSGAPKLREQLGDYL
jgi:DNA-directed RNA polymerase sigma subunit (sigma70/sigma32)